MELFMNLLVRASSDMLLMYSDHCILLNNSYLSFSRLVKDGECTDACNQGNNMLVVIHFYKSNALLAGLSAIFKDEHKVLIQFRG